jgi:hypothetical protein
MSCWKETGASDVLGSARALARSRWRPRHRELFVSNKPTALTNIKGISARAPKCAREARALSGTYCGAELRALFNRRSDFIAPLSLGSIIVPDVVQA